MKHLKKSMFISTVLMVVMLVAALSTATFAWYTSNNTASSSVTQVGAAEATSANIGIGFYKGATASTISFQNLTDSLNNNKGDLNPTVPVKYYDDTYTLSGDQNYQVIPAQFTTSTDVPSGGYVADGMGVGSNYKRVVNLTAAELGENAANIVAASTYTHSFANPTNLTGIGNNYEKLYRITRYAYNNAIVADETLSASDPAVDRVITLANDVYTVVTADPSTACYKIVKVFTINESGTDYSDFNFASTTSVTMSCAYNLSGGKWFPNEGGYLVAYYEYGYVGYKADVTTVDTTAQFIGYAATAAATLNDGDILASAIISNENYPTISEIKYNAANFAYVCQTYAGSEVDNGALTDKVESVISWSGFSFNKAAVDADGFFLANGTAATIGSKYSGTSDTFVGGGYDVVPVTGKDSRGIATETFYVTNNGSNTISSLTIGLNVTGDNAELLRIAVFKNGTYVGTMATNNNSDTTFGTILKGAKAADMPTYKAYNSLALGQLLAGNTNAAEFQIVAWFDGKLLDDAAAGKNCAFTLTFTAQ
jgi:hypothetical protein